MSGCFLACKFWPTTMPALCDSSCDKQLAQRATNDANGALLKNRYVLIALWTGAD
jgi:hypothetical protein